MTMIGLKNPLLQKKPLLTLLQSLEDEGFVVGEKEKAWGFPTTCKEVVDCLDVVDGGKGIKEELLTNLEFIPKFFEDVRRML